MTDATRAGYDVVAASYAEIIPDTRYEAPVDLAMVRHFVDALPDRPAAVLDAGCGTGRMITLLAEFDGALEITGSDLSSGMLAQARSRHPDLDFVRDGITEIDLVDFEWRVEFPQQSALGLHGGDHRTGSRKLIAVGC